MSAPTRRSRAMRDAWKDAGEGQSFKTWVMDNLDGAVGRGFEDPKMPPQEFKIREFAEAKGWV